MGQSNRFSFGSTARSGWQPTEDATRSDTRPVDSALEQAQEEEEELAASAALSARPAQAPTGTYVSRRRWVPDEPKALVVACSDGRMDAQMDEFLRDYLRLANYDRVYIPGGPGGLAGGACEYMRADQLRRECIFLIQAHKVEEVVLIFHGAGEGGPDAAVCGDYRRKHATEPPAELNRLQEADLVETLRNAFIATPGLRFRAFRAEVGPDMAVRFAPLSS